MTEPRCPETRLEFSGVSKVPLSFNNSFHSPWERTLLNSPPSWGWDKLAPCQPPQNLPCTPIPETAVWWLVLGAFCRAFVFSTKDLFMMASYCLHWKLLAFASGRALSSEPHVWTGRLEWWRELGDLRRARRRPHHHVRAQALYSSKDPMQMQTAWEKLYLKHGKQVSSGALVPFGDLPTAVPGVFSLSFPLYSHTGHKLGVGLFLSGPAFLFWNKWRKN